MNNIIEIFKYDFMIRALIAGVLIAGITPFIGGFLVVKRMPMMADALAHVSLAGVALGLFLGIDPILATIALSVGTALLIEHMRQRSNITADTILAMTLPGGLSISLILVSLANGFNSSLISYLFGSLTTVTWNELAAMAVLVGIACIMVAFLYKQILYTSFDEMSAKASGIRVEAINYILMVVTALTVAVSIKSVGALLVGALTIIPVSTAMQITRGFKQSLYMAVGLAILEVVSGLILSYFADFPAGATIVLLSLIVFGFVSLFTKRINRLFRS